MNFDFISDYELHPLKTLLDVYKLLLGLFLTSYMKFATSNLGNIINPFNL